MGCSGSDPVLERAGTDTLPKPFTPFGGIELGYRACRFVGLLVQVRDDVPVALSRWMTPPRSLSIQTLLAFLCGSSARLR